MRTIPDDRVFHVWQDLKGEEHYIPPTYYEDSGIPSEDDTGEEMVYVRTEINQDHDIEKMHDALQDVHNSGAFECCCGETPCCGTCISTKVENALKPLRSDNANSMEH